MTDINTLLDLLAGHQWAALSASVLMICLAIGRRLAPVLWTYIPAWARPIPLLLAAGIPEYVAQIQLAVAWPFAILYALMFGLGAIGVIGAVGGVVKRQEPKVRGDEPAERTRARKLQRDDRATLTERSPTLLVLLALVVTGCAGWQKPVQAGLDVAQAICQNELLRSGDVQKMLLDSGVLPEAIPAVVAATCAAIPGLQALLDQADKARAPRARVLVNEAKARGLL
jgi:hypothetical protein